MAKTVIDPGSIKGIAKRFTKASKSDEYALQREIIFKIESVVSAVLDRVAADPNITRKTIKNVEYKDLLK